MTSIHRIKQYCESQGWTSDILYMFEYGSVVYGTVTEKSDRDFVIILDEMDERTYEQVSIAPYDLHIMTLKKFQGYLDKMHPMCLECYFYAPVHGTFAKPINFNVDLQKLREVISSKANNSYCKAKKKITLDFEDDYIGIKSLFHSLRLIDLGLQIAKGQEVDLQKMQGLWFEMSDDFYKLGFTWDQLHEKYKPQYNTLLTKFRILAPKESKNGS